MVIVYRNQVNTVLVKIATFVLINTQGMDLGWIFVVDKTLNSNCNTCNLNTGKCLTWDNYPSYHCSSGCQEQCDKDPFCSDWTEKRCGADWGQNCKCKLNQQLFGECSA